MLHDIMKKKMSGAGEGVSIEEGSLCRALAGPVCTHMNAVPGCEATVDILG